MNNTQTAVIRDVGFPAINIGALIEKAVDAKAAVEVMERLQLMRKEIRAEQAEVEFDAAMKAFQSECGPIKKVKQGQNAKYAPLEFIQSQIQQLKDRHGFSENFETDEATKPGEVIIYCEVCHVGGHKRRRKVVMPLPEKVRNRSGADCQNSSQQYMSAITYGKRAALVNAYGLVVAGEDTDCSTPQKPPGPAKATKKTLEFMIQQFADIEDKAIAYAIDMGWIMPDEWMEQWPLEQVPTSKQGIAELRKKIEAHQ